MPAIDRVALVEITSEVVSAYLAKNHVPAIEIPILIASVHAAFTGLGKAPEPAVVADPLKPPVPIRRTVTDEHIVSLEDGKPYKTLKRHLSKLGLTPEAYRIKWGLPHDYPMMSPAFARQRSQLAKIAGLGAVRRKG